MNIKKNEIYTLTITDIGTQGEGIGKLDGFTVFVKGALPQEEVKALILKVNKSYAYAKLSEIITPSPKRVTPPCPIFGKCGGCSLQHLSYPSQLEFKRERVYQSLTRIGGFDNPTVLPAIGMDKPFNYRNKAQYPVAEDAKGLHIGFYAQASHRIIDCNTCLIGAESDTPILKAVRSLIERCNIPVYNGTTGKGLIRHILIRTGKFSGEVMVCLVINAKRFNYTDALVKSLSGFPEIKSIVLNFNQSRTNVILGDTCKTVYGNDYITDSIGSLKFRISALSFFQVNPLQTEKLYSTALDFCELTGNETVIDAYCGIGTISLFLAERAKKVYGIEIIPQAIANANENKVLNNISNAEFIVGKSEEAVPELYTKHGITPDTVVVDPPRKGCDTKLLDMLLTMQPQRIVYVSCDPATLARDLKILCNSAYTLVKAQPVDMFPHTTHTETVCLLSKKECSK
jgi:23S rRNA (uracil1939-C5)-methyltransferase